VAFISEEQIDQVRSRADIYAIISERLALKRAGRNWKANCPFHQEKTPSLIVSPEKQIFHCFGCGVGGNAIHFLMQFEGWSFVETVQRLAERFGVTLDINKEDNKEYQARKKEKDLFFKINRLVAKHYFTNLQQSSAAEKARRYLEGRGFKSEIIQKFVLGYSSATGREVVSLLEEKKIPLSLGEKLGLVRQRDEGRYYDFFRDRLMFPIFSSEGQVVGFGGRILEEGEPKYINSPDSPIYNKSESVYGLFEAKESLRQTGKAFLVEGNLDCLMMAQEGFSQVVAPLGTAVTPAQVRTISRYADEITVIFDGDEAGEKAAIRALPIFLDFNIPAKQLLLPPHEDPDSFLRTHGAQVMAKKLESAPPLFETVMLRQWQMTEPTSLGKGQFIKKILPSLSRVQGEAQMRLFVRRLSELTGIEEQWVWQELKGGQKEVVTQTSSPVAPRGEMSAPPMERRLIEIALNAKQDISAPLFRDLCEEDFSDEGLRKVWQTVMEIYQRQGVILLSSVLEALDEGPYRQWLESASIEWDEGGDQSKIVEDCLTYIRRRRVKEKMKALKMRLARAEQEHDQEVVTQLIREQDVLIKQMSHYSS